VRRGDATISAVLRDTLAHFATVTDKPGVHRRHHQGQGRVVHGGSGGDQTYHFHAGAPSLKDYVAATREIDRA
jgi:hypothetical protein